MSSFDRKFFDPIACLSAKAATGVGTAVDVTQHQHVIVQVTAALNSSLTFKLQGSVSSSVPDFSAAQTGTNHWDYVSAYDLQDPSTVIAGDTGVALNNDTVANNTRQYLVNVDGLRWFSMEVTSYTDGSVTTNVIGFNNA